MGKNGYPPPPYTSYHFRFSFQWNDFKLFVLQEYGFDEFEIQVDALRENENVVVVDDLLATGIKTYFDHLLQFKY